MRDDKIYSQAELAKVAGVSEEEIGQIIEYELLEPARLSKGGEAFYNQQCLDELVNINKLRELGFSLRDIKKIKKKVGLPRREVSKKPLKATKYLTVGELAKKAALNPRTIKFWEEKGIITPVARSEGGFRLYTRDYVEYLTLIKDLQFFGYKLDKIKETIDTFRKVDEIYKDPSLREKGSKEKSLANGEELALKIKNDLSRLREGIKRWEEFISKRRKQIAKIGKEK